MDERRKKQRRKYTGHLVADLSNHSEIEQAIRFASGRKPSLIGTSQNKFVKQAAAEIIVKELEK